MEYKSFETERLIIRPTGIEDAEAIRLLMNTPKFLHFVGDRKLRSDADAEQYIKDRMLPQLERLGYSSYIMVKKEDGQKIGTCGLYDRDGVDGIDIGFGLLPEAEGQGFAYEAASCLMKAAVDTFNIKEINGITAKANVASQGLLEKLGLKKIGTTTLPGETEEILLYQYKVE